jgi:hypothetical protein
MNVVPAVAQPTTPSVIDASRKGVADTVRGMGDGASLAYDFATVAADTVMIQPIDALNTASRSVKAKTAGTPLAKVGGIAGSVIGGGGFVVAYMNLIVDGMLRAPGTTFKQVAHGLANKIDGGAQQGAAEITPPTE